MDAIITPGNASFEPPISCVTPVISNAVGIKLTPITIIIGPTT